MAAEEGVERVGTDRTVPYRTYGFNGLATVVVVTVLVTKSDAMINHFAPSDRERRTRERERGAPPEKERTCARLETRKNAGEGRDGKKEIARTLAIL